MPAPSNEYAYGSWWVFAVNAIFVFAFALSFLAPRRRLARREERDMIEKFGEQYLACRARTLAFIPSLNSLRQPRVSAPLPEAEA